MTVLCEYIKFFNSQKSFSFLSNALRIIKQKHLEIENTVRVPSRMKLTKNLVFLHYFSKLTGILFFVLNYMYISLLLKMINGFSWPSKIMASPFNWRLHHELRMQRFYLTCNLNERYNFCILSPWHLRLLSWVFDTNRVCHVWCNFEPGYTCWTTIIFGTLKDGGLEINDLTL